MPDLSVNNKFDYALSCDKHNQLLEKNEKQDDQFQVCSPLNRLKQSI